MAFLKDGLLCSFLYTNTTFSSTLVLMQYHSTLYLAKYSEKVVVPTAVVQFGPYRIVRYPIYASVMLLFSTYFAALRAPMSSLFIVAVCLMYYGQKAKLEEALMLDSFKESYGGGFMYPLSQYGDKVAALVQL